MERELRIFEMTEEADPTALARSRLLHKHLSQEYAAMRERRAINLRFVPRPLVVRHAPRRPGGEWVSPSPSFSRDALAWS
jgi:hypothetical protein